ICLLSLCLSLANSSFGEAMNNEPGQEVLLSMKTSGGHVAPEWMGWAKEVVIYKDGSVRARFRQNEASSWVEKAISKLDKEVVDGLITDLRNLRTGEIAFPDTPVCYDLPTTNYSAVNEQNE